MKKILIFHHYNSSIGAGLCLLHIVKSICNDYEVVVVLPEGGDLNDMLNDLRVKTINIENTPVAYGHYNGSKMPFFSFRHLKNIISILKNARVIKKIIIDQAPDIIAINSMTLFWIGIVSNSLNIPIVCFHRETYKKGLLGFRSRIIKYVLLRYFSGIAYISNFDRVQTGKTDKISIRITDKVDLELYSCKNKCLLRDELGLPHNKKLILFTGGCSRLKGGLIAVKAMELIKEDFILVFLQYEPDIIPSTLLSVIKERIKKIFKKNYKYLIECEIRNNSLSDRVILRPATNCVNKYFMACDAVVFPSEEAHQARPIYEAGAAQIPIFISDFLNTREFLTEKNGYLFSPHNPKDLALRIDECFSNEYIKKNKIIYNYQMTLDNHNITKLKEEVLSFLNSIL